MAHNVPSKYQDPKWEGEITVILWMLTKGCMLVTQS